MNGPATSASRRVAFLSLAALLACGGEGGPAPATKGTYVLHLLGYGAYAGRRMALKLKDESGETTYATYQGSIQPDGTRTITLEEVLETGKRYRVDHYIDLDNSGGYTRPVGSSFADPSWRRTIVGDANGFEDYHTNTSSWTDISPF
jgi:hypothetical protein